MQVIRTDVVSPECLKEIACRALIVTEPTEGRSEVYGYAEKSWSTKKN